MTLREALSATPRTPLFFALVVAAVASLGASVFLAICLWNQRFRNLNRQNRIVGQRPQRKTQAGSRLSAIVPGFPAFKGVKMKDESLII